MMETPLIRAFLDASVVYPALLRNILMHLAMQGLFQAYWSRRIHGEWIEALLRDRHDLSRARLERTRDLMDTNIQDALVEGYEHRIEALNLPIPNDRHVLAAAIQCEANVIVTANLRDFPDSVLAGYGIEAVHPDAFITSLLNENPQAVIGALHRLRQALVNPPITAAEFLAAMRRLDLIASAGALAPHIDAL